MEPERDEPGARKRTEIFAGFSVAQSDISSGAIDINFRVGRRDRTPVWVGALRRHKIRKMRQRIKDTYRGVRGKISRKKTKVKIRFPKNGAGKSLVQQRFVRT